MHRKRAERAEGVPLTRVLALLAALWTPLHAGPHQTAAGWLQLEQDQRAYRDRVAPLDLRERRELSIVEREQRNTLEAVRQRQRRVEQLERRRARLTPPRQVPRQEPRRDWRADRRRVLEAQRLDLRMEQYRLPFGKRRP